MATSSDKRTEDLDLAESSISGTTTQSKSKPAKKKKTEAVVDSWEDDVASSSDEAEQPHSHENMKHEEITETKEYDRNDDPVEFEAPYPSQPSNPVPSSYRNASPSKRPEKSTVAVNRMIANSLGLRTKITPDQRAFHQSQVKNEKQRREAEKTKKKEEEHLKESVWND